MPDLKSLAYARLSSSISTVANEAEVRDRWARSLSAATGIDFDFERGRRDLSYNNVIVEFKDLGLFDGRSDSPAFRNAIEDRLPKYLSRKAVSDSLPCENYVGIAIDGRHVSFGQMRGGRFQAGRLLPVSEMVFCMVADACAGGLRRAVTSENLVADFGHSSTCGMKLMRALSAALARALGKRGGARGGKVRMLFEEWQALYGQVAGLGRVQQASLSATLGLSWGGEPDEALAANLFVTHTFHSLLVKLLVAEVVAAHGLASSPSLVDDMLAEPDAGRLSRLRLDIEEGGFFNAVGLKGFVEEVIFSWYLDATAVDVTARSEVLDGITSILAQLHLYRLDSLHYIRRTQDVLRDFYQEIVPSELRKSLGEFYTPDWLVDYTLDQLDYSDQEWCDKRLLDPTCGSGTFLLAAIARKRAALERAGHPRSAILQAVTSSVWGFDLNPLAVQTARANVLMALADLLSARGGNEVEIPVLLADAVYSPAPDPDGDTDEIIYTIGSDTADLKVILPTALAVDRPRLDRVFEIMGEEVERGSFYNTASARLVAANALTVKEASVWAGSLKATYDRVLDLHGREWNGIWFRIVRNFFWSATAGKFDAIVGNPPWVRWSNLPVAYRNRAKPTCEKYDIFSDTPYFGGNELDIAAMITFTTADKWLGEGGRLAFVITQTVFQSGSSQGFRRFKIDDEHRLVPLAVDDLKALRPFPDAANSTSVALFEKRRTQTVPYPVPYREWLGMRATTGSNKLVKRIPPGATKATVLESMVFDNKEARPASAGVEGSAWAVMDPATFVRRGALLTGPRWRDGRKGITTDLNGVYFVNILESCEHTRKLRVRTRPNEGRTDIGGARDFWVEPDLLFPLLKGAGDFGPNELRPVENMFAFIPNRGIHRDALASIPLQLDQRSMKGTRTYFQAYENQLRLRSTYRGRLAQQGAHYAAIFNVGEYTFSPFKVVWPEMAQTFKAAVCAGAVVPLLGERPYIPDHKIYFVDFEKPEPAYYLCGLLNAPSVRTVIESHSLKLQIGNIFKYLSLPAFNPSEVLHQRLARVTHQAHGERSAARRTKASDLSQQVAEKIVERTCRERCT